MAKVPKPEREMTDEEIRGVFETLKLPTSPSPQPNADKQAGPLIFFRISGDSPPLDTRYAS
jgi:hypothetical protein